jgi:hypothetical protein
MESHEHSPHLGVLSVLIATSWVVSTLIDLIDWDLGAV